MDSRWDAKRREDLLKVSMGRGVLSEQAERHLKRLRWHWEKERGCSLRWVHVPAPVGVVEGEVRKVMGGVVVGVWGDLSEAVVSPGPEQDASGRWAVVWLRGRQGGGVAIFSVYRPPDGASGGLVARQGAVLGLASQAAVQKAFYQDLGKAVGVARASGMEVVLAGDFNADPQGRSTGGRALAVWCQQQGLSPAGGARTRCATFTYVAAGDRVGSSCIDHIFCSAPALVAGVEEPVQVGLGPWGHKLLTAHLGLAKSVRLNLAPDARVRQAEWRAGRRAQERVRRGKYRTIEAEAGGRFRGECGALPEGLEEQLEVLEQLARWCEG